jgi:hypothetical protein
VRLETADVPGAGAIPVTADAIWIYGSDVPEAAWVDVRAPRAGPVYLPLREIAEGPSPLAVRLVLEEARSVEGTVVGERAEPVGGASITVFRIVDVAGAGRERDRLPRVFVSEVTADADGRFRLNGLGEGKYEVVTLHQQWGRASVPLSESERRIEIHLKAAMLRGRVISAGRPVAGVDVITVPDPDAARAAEDLFDVKGGDTRTASDGRFAVFAAPVGGELRIGGGRYPIRRIALPRMAAGSLDLGDIDLGAAIEISVVLNDDPDCVLRATGPVGRAGLQVVRGTRVAPGMFRVAIPEPGLWEFGLSCGSVERGLSPGVREIGPQLSGKEVWFLVR